ncbi:hypothetical protein ABPG77_008266 [Micractinium sp. CCAP 211/92]
MRHVAAGAVVEVPVVKMCRHRPRSWSAARPILPVLVQLPGSCRATHCWYSRCRSSVTCRMLRSPDDAGSCSSLLPTLQSGAAKNRGKQCALSLPCARHVHGARPQPPSKFLARRHDPCAPQWHQRLATGGSQCSASLWPPQEGALTQQCGWPAPPGPPLPQQERP